MDIQEQIAVVVHTISHQGGRIDALNATLLSVLQLVKSSPGLREAIEAQLEQNYSSLRMPVVKTVLEETRRNTAFITLKNPLLTGLRALLMPLLPSIPGFTAAALRNVSGQDTPPPPWIPDAR